ncbi:MAG TPA: hypothetical protein VHA52_02330 [Candidatus Babeliaceae bacterium]|nr:hypothetical protein [Candidatus Babeliaceae bacterium]
MDGTILGQGSFVVGATVSSQTIVIPSNADWMRVLNYTQMGTAGGASASGVEFYWQRGMAAGTGVVKYKINTTDTHVLNGDTLVGGGFTLYDPSGQSQGALPLLSAAVATTASTDATRPVVSTTNTAGISVGTVVRLSNTAQTDVNGQDFVVGAVTANTSFTLMTASNALATAPGAIGGAGFYRIVNTNPLFYPRRRLITNITQAVNAQISTSVEHSLTVGQEIRLNIPDVSGMTQLNPNPLNNYYPTASSVPVIVVSIVDAYNFTINIDTTSYTAFTYPTIAQQPSSFPTVIPVGEDTATSLASNSGQVPQYQGQNIYNANSGILADSTVNTGFLGMILGTGGNGNSLGAAITGPAGTATSDVVYWVAGKSTYGGL